MSCRFLYSPAIFEHEEQKKLIRQKVWTTVSRKTKEELRMPPKAVPTIKSISKTDVLTLVCEWGECQEVFNKFEELMNHITDHIARFYNDHTSGNDPDAPYACLWKECGHDGFQGIQEIMRHINFHAFHVKIKSQGMILLLKNNHGGCLLDASSRNMIPELPDRLACSWSHCQLVFDNPVEFYSHVRNHCDCFPDGNKPPGGCKCDWEGCNFVGKSKHKLKDHMRSHTQEKFVACPTCGGLYSNTTKFFDHIKRQSQSELHTYQCSHCNKRFCSERLLRDHMRHHVNHYKCPFCDMTVPNPSGLRTHLRYRHTEDRPHACNQCEYRAKTAIDLRRHVESHKPDGMQCEFENCKFKCKTYWDMNAHYKLKHEESPLAEGTSKYLCHLCGNTYWCGNKLTEHLRRKHKFKWPSGHTRFRYKVHEDGYFRLQTVRYESIELTEQMLHTRMEEQVTPAENDSEDAQLHQPGEFTYKSPVKTHMITTQQSPAKTRAKQKSMRARLKKRLLGAGDTDENRDVDAASTPRKIARLETIDESDTSCARSAGDCSEVVSGGPSRTESAAIAGEADYSYNLEMLGDVALQNSDVHSTQDFAATSTPQRDFNTKDDSPTPLVDNCETSLSDFEVARRQLGVFTPVKEKQRKRRPRKTKPSLPDILTSSKDDIEIISQGGTMLDPNAFSTVLSVDESDNQTVLTSGNHQILITSNVPVQFSGVVEVVPGDHEGVPGEQADFDNEQNSEYVIQEIGHGTCSRQCGVSECQTNNQRILSNRGDSLQCIEDDIISTAQELGISIQD